MENIVKKKDEPMLIIKKYDDLIKYTYDIVRKFPKNERFTLVSEIKDCLLKGFQLLLYAERQYSKSTKIKYLTDLDVNLQVLKFYIRLSKKYNYINSKNYEAWSYKITIVCNMLGAWMNTCLAR